MNQTFNGQGGRVDLDVELEGPFANGFCCLFAANVRKNVLGHLRVWMGRIPEHVCRACEMMKLCGHITVHGPRFRTTYRGSVS